MKYTKFIFSSLLCVSAAMAFTSCDKDDIIVGTQGSDNIGTTDANVVYASDALDQQEGVEFTFSGIGQFNIYAGTSQAIKGDCSVIFAYDSAVLDAYNEKNGTSYEAVPASAVSFSNDGKATFAAGAVKSDAVTVSVAPGGAMQSDQVYAVPMSFSVNNGQAAGGDNSMVVLVRDLSAYPGADKIVDGKAGMKMMAVFEVNDRNPLNALGFTLKESGKQLFDQVVLFASNINYNATTGSIYLNHNENVQAILDHADKYIRPLQQRGIKAILGILGNHDMAGISTLSPAASKQFAQDVKQTIDSYGLDGVFLDDEYTNYDAAASTTNPLFQARSTEAASRMGYDMKQAMPDKLVISYKYEDLYSGVAIDGKQPGEFFDYVVNDYWDTRNPCETYPGLRQDQAGTGSWNCSEWSQCIPSNSYWTDRFSLSGMRQDGYGVLMIFNFRVEEDYWLTRYILRDLGSTATAFYGEELQYDGIYYGKDY